MASRDKTLKQLVDLGIKYGPIAYQGLRAGADPAQDVARRKMAHRTARSIAVEHAEHLVRGSVLPVFDGDLRVWVVFSGDQPVATHPTVRTPMETLLAHYDLGKRMTPEQARAARRPGLRRRRRSKAIGGAKDTGRGGDASGTTRPDAAPGITGTDRTTGGDAR